jgi:hypothetical protein
LSPGTVTEPWNVRAGRIVWVLDVDDIISYRNCLQLLREALQDTQNHYGLIVEVIRAVLEVGDSFQNCIDSRGSRRMRL